MKTSELIKHNNELNLPLSAQLEIMEAHAQRLETVLKSIASSTMSHFLDYEHAYTRCREKASAAISSPPAS